MIVGIGVDIIEVARVRRAVERNPRFVERVFTERETAYCRGKKNEFQHLAARFAAKEAFFKAIGRRLAWIEAETINQPSGRPELVIHSAGEPVFDRAHVSLSHLAEYAVAIVVLERDQSPARR